MKKYDCELCGIETFKTKQAYERHIESRKHKLREEGNVSVYKCLCGKSFLHRSGLSVHKKKCQKVSSHSKISKVSQSYMDEKIREIKEEFNIERQLMIEAFERVLEKNAVTPRTTKNIETNVENQTNNNNITININAFGKENLDYITDNMIIRCIDRVYNSIPCLIEKIHFDPNHPENHNIRITNKKLPYASIMGDNHKWVYVDRTKAIESMVEKSYDMLTDTYQENKDKICSIKKEQFDIFADKMEGESKEVMRKLKTDVEVMILNG